MRTFHDAMKACRGKRWPEGAPKAPTFMKTCTLSLATDCFICSSTPAGAPAAALTFGLKSSCESASVAKDRCSSHAGAGTAELPEVWSQHRYRKAVAFRNALVKMIFST